MSLTLTRRHNVDRFGYLIPTKYGNVPMVEAVATYRPGEGRFGGAVAVEEGTTNLLSESVFDSLDNIEVVNINGWSRARRITRTSGRLFNTVNIPCDADTEYTMSIYARAVQVSPNSEFRIYMGDNGDLPNVSLYIQPGSEWRRYVLTRRTSPNATHIIRASIHLENLVVGDIIEIADWQLEAKPFATSFVDRTRAGGVLTYDASIMPVQSATVAAWVWVPPSSHWPTSDFRRIISNNNSSASSRAIVLYFSPGNRRLSLSIRDDANTQQVISTPSPITEGWHHIAATWDVSRMALYVDGSLVVQQTSPSLPTSHPNPRIAVGARTDNRDHLNGLIDELLILPYAASEEEIRAWYEATGPLPPHPQATLQWDWQAVRPATMVAL